MAVAAQEQITPEAPQPSQAPRRQRAVWPKPSQLRQSAPILRLLAEIWAIPEVSKIGLWVGEGAVQVWVLMPEDDREAESRISRAEREYLNSTTLHSFDLDVVPTSEIREEILPPFETILER